MEHHFLSNNEKRGATIDNIGVYHFLKNLNYFKLVD